MKKTLLLLTGIMLLSVSGFGHAEAGNLYGITIPYAEHGANGYWSGIALSNTGPYPLVVTVYDVGSGKQQINSFTLQPYSRKVGMLNEFTGGFTSQDSRYSLLFTTPKASGNDIDDYFRATLFMGNSNGGFGFQSFEADDID